MDRTITTARLVLAPLVSDDVEALWRMLVLADVRRYLCDDKVLPRSFVEGMAAANLTADGLGLFAIRDAEGFAGFVGIKPVSAEIAACIPAFRGELEVSVGLHPSRWGRGLAGEAVAAVLAQWRAHGDGRRVVAVADAPNVKSRRMLERAGFVAAGEHGGSAYPLVSYVPAGSTGTS